MTRNIIIPPLHHFTILGQKNAQNMPHYYTAQNMHFNGFACVVYVFRARIMQLIQCKMDFEN